MAYHLRLSQLDSAIDDSAAHETDQEEKEEEKELQLFGKRVPIPNAFVFDISALLRRKNDIDIAVSRLKTALTNGGIDPSLLLYKELLDCLADADSYFVAYSIFSALIFFDREFKRNSSSKSVLIPHKLERLLRALQDASVQLMGELS